MSLTEIMESARTFEHPSTLDEPVQHKDTEAHK